MEARLPRDSVKPPVVIASCPDDRYPLQLFPFLRPHSPKPSPSSAVVPLRAARYASASTRSPSTTRTPRKFQLVPAETRHRSEEHTSELQSLRHLVCRLLLE